MATSFPYPDCDATRESTSASGALRTSCHHAYASDTSSNLSCSSSSTDTSGSSRSSSTCTGARSSSWERTSVGAGASSCKNSKPHKAHDAAWTAIRGLESKEGSVGITHFKLLRQIGHGDIGCVYLSQLRGTNCIFAMKVMDKVALSLRKKVQRLDAEKEILELVDHPFLPTLYAHFDTEQFSCLVMEFCPGGDLHALRQRQSGKRFSLRAARFYAAEVLVALEYLHMMGVVYRDLKPENVLVREDGHIMLTDFDLSLRSVANPTLISHPFSSSRRRRQSFSTSTSSCMLPPCASSPYVSHSIRISCFPLGKRKRVKLSRKGSQVHQSRPLIQPHRHHQLSFPELVAEPTQARSTSFVGTHEYLAPEIISGNGHGSAVDWWTFGIFLYELLIGRTPFKGSGNELTLMNIMKQPLRFPEDLDLEVGEAARGLIQGLLAKDPRKRLGSARGAADIKRHPFFRGVNWALIRCATPPEVPKSHRQDPAMKKSSQKSSIHHLSAAGKRKMWTISRLNSDSLPDFEYF